MGKRKIAGRKRSTVLFNGRSIGSSRSLINWKKGERETETARVSCRWPLRRKRGGDKSDIYGDGCDEASSERNLCSVMEGKKNCERRKKYYSPTDDTVSVSPIILLTTVYRRVSFGEVGKLLLALCLVSRIAHLNVILQRHTWRSTL